MNVVNRQVLFAEGDDEFAHPIASRRLSRSVSRSLKEGGAFVRVVAKRVTQDTKGTGGIAEASGDLGGILLLDEVGPQGLILALDRGIWGQEEVAGLEEC